MAWSALRCARLVSGLVALLFSVFALYALLLTLEEHEL
jgi:hypothetical protein